MFHKYAVICACLLWFVTASVAHANTYTFPISTQGDDRWILGAGTWPLASGGLQPDGTGMVAYATFDSPLYYAGVILLRFGTGTTMNGKTIIGASLEFYTTGSSTVNGYSLSCDWIADWAPASAASYAYPLNGSALSWPIQTLSNVSTGQLALSAFNNVNTTPGGYTAFRCTVQGASPSTPPTGFNQMYVNEGSTGHPTTLRVETNENVTPTATTPPTSTPTSLVTPTARLTFTPCGVGTPGYPCGPSCR